MAWVADWTEPNELYALTMDHLEDLREALNERYDIANALEDPSVTLTKPAFCTDNNLALELWNNTAVLVDVISDALDDLYASFVNTSHEPAAWGAWAPRWLSVADILSALSETAETKPLELYSSTVGAWFTQQKRILDEMRWTQQNISDATHFASYGRQGTAPAGDPSWAEAVYEFNANSWVSVGAQAPTHYAKKGSATDPDKYQIIRLRSQYKTAATGFDFPTISNDWEDTPSTRQPKKTWDYLQIFLNVQTSYENNDYPIDEALFGIVHSNGTPNADEDFIAVSGGFVLPESDGITAFTLGDFDTVTVTEPGYNEINGWIVPVAAYIHIRYKWDVLNGLNKVA